MMKTICSCLLALCVLSFAAPSLWAADAPAAPVQIALVGCAHSHTGGFPGAVKKRTDIKVKYVWDHDPVRAAKFSKSTGAPIATDLNQIWNDRDIAAVVIYSETNRHLELVLAAAKAGKHVFAEKPLGFTARDAYAMADALKGANLMFQTGYSMRSDPIMQFLKQQVEAGAFGTITRIRGCTAHDGALPPKPKFDSDFHWFVDPAQAGVGGYGDLGTHSLDLLLWLMNEPVERVSAAISPGTARYANCDELGEGLLVFKSGAIGSLAASWDDVANPVSLEICGTLGHAVVVNGQLFFQCKKVPGADGKTPWTQLPTPKPHALDAFLDAVAGKKDVTLIGASEAAYRAAVMEALYNASRQQKWLDVQQPGK